MFEFIKKIFKRKQSDLEYDMDGFGDGIEQGRETVVSLERGDYDMSDGLQRDKFVESCLEQMADAVTEIDSLNGEYLLVDYYLKDMEEVEAIKGKHREILDENANAILLLSMDEKQYKGKKSTMRENDYKKMERMEERADEAISKIRDAEKYQEAIHQDMQKLEGEKHACMYRKHEALLSISNLRGMAVICICAVFATLFLLIILQFAFEMDTKIGYILTMGAAAITLVMTYLKYGESQSELKRASNSLNKVILLQNKVKIRYINNTNLLEYLYTKYETHSGRELERMVKAYQDEKQERQRMVQVESDLEFHQQQLIKVLKKHQLFDPMIWIHQPEAILDKKEMVEVRHNLILRRQKLRKQIEYNNQIGERASSEIKQLVKEFPIYAEEILGKVTFYEEKMKK